MWRTRKILVALAVMMSAALLLSGCSTTIGGVRLSGRVGTRIPGGFIADGDGDPQWVPPIEPPGDSLFVIVRGRY